jgi:cytochrome c biogenesis protein CcdA
MLTAARPLLLLVLFAYLAVGAEIVGSRAAGPDGVAVSLAMERLSPGRGVLISTLTPRNDDGGGWHLYGSGLPRDGLEGIGRPTLVELPEGGPLRALGPASSPTATTEQVVAALNLRIPLFVAGPVILRQDIAWDPAAEPLRTRVLVTAMSCNAETCHLPLEREPVELLLGGATGAGAAPPALPGDDEPLPGPALGSLTADPLAGVSAVIHYLATDADRGWLIARLTPPPGHWHLYHQSLPRRGLGGIGRPTLLEIPPGQAIAADGPQISPTPSATLSALGRDFPVYRDGPVTIAVPVRLLPHAAGSPATVALTFMACDPTSCRAPVEGRKLRISLPGLAGDAVTAAATTPISAPLSAMTVSSPSTATAPAGSGPLPNGVWQHPSNVAELESLLSRAATAGQTLLLDFTGPSCLNCQIMARTVFPQAPVQAAFAKLPLIEINTDPPHLDLGPWQAARFGTSARPLYVRLAPDGRHVLWDRFVPHDDQAGVAAFAAFIAGDGAGARSDIGIWAAILGGLFTLLMPCTYPMIPFTITFFAKQAAAGRRTALLGAAYALGITVFFVGLGLLVAGVLNLSPEAVSGNPWVNLGIGVLFIVFGISLLGLFELTVPSWLLNGVGGGRSGYVGALIMGLTFAITAFTCTAPVAGAILGPVIVGQDLGYAAFLLTVYALTVALPFFLLSLAPGALQRLPRSGGWMGELKLIGGFVELGAALKFFIICDYAWGWGVLHREVVLTLWAILCLLSAGVLLRHWPARGQGRLVGLTLRAVCLAGFTALALYAASGLGDRALAGIIEGMLLVY